MNNRRMLALVSLQSLPSMAFSGSWGAMLCYRWAVSWETLQSCKMLCKELDRPLGTQPSYVSA